MESNSPSEASLSTSNFPDLRRRLAVTKTRMAAGAPSATIGTPTGLCEPFLLSMLGAQVDFGRVTPADIQKYKDRADLSGYPVVVGPNLPFPTAVQTILEQEQVGIRVLYIVGRVSHERATNDEAHMIGIVKGSGDKYAVIDSLSRNGLEEVDGTQGVIDRIGGRFNTVPRGLTYSVVFTDAEKAARRGTARRSKIQDIGYGIHL